MIPVWLKIKIGQVICHPLVGRAVARYYHDRIPNRGLVFNTEGPYVANDVKALIYWGLYESAEVRYIFRYLAPNLDVVELGCSLGVVSSFIANRLESGRRLVCVEANPNLIPNLESNLRANAPQSAINVVHAAVCYTPDADARTTLLLGDDNLGSRLADDGQGVSVPAVTLASILDTYQIGDYTLVADIEGAEAALLTNDLASLARCRQIIIELHDSHVQGRHVSVDEMCATIEQAGFQLVDCHGPVCVYRREPAPQVAEKSCDKHVSEPSVHVQPVS